MGDRDLKGGVEVGHYTGKRVMGSCWDQWRQHMAQSGYQSLTQHIRTHSPTIAVAQACRGQPLSMQYGGGYVFVTIPISQY